MTTAFVLGGGGVLGAVEVGMLRALLERDITPDLVLGTSIGALNGAILASDPTPAVVERLTALWKSTDHKEVVTPRPLDAVRRAVTGDSSAIYPWGPVRRKVRAEIGDVAFADLPVRFQVVAACVERSAEHWFSEGSVADAVLASAAVPGLWPPYRIDGEHYLDGGIVNSIPLGRAVQLGATRIFVLQVGRIDRPLQVPRRPWEVARVSFEIARRHRFIRELAEVPDGVEAHVLPASGTSARDDTLFAHRDFAGIQRRIDASYASAVEYLDALEDTP